MTYSLLYFQTCDQENEKRLRIELAAMQQKETNHSKENDVNMRNKNQGQKRQVGQRRRSFVVAAQTRESLLQICMDELVEVLN